MNKAISGIVGGDGESVGTGCGEWWGGGEDFVDVGWWGCRLCHF